MVNSLKFDENIIVCYNSTEITLPPKNWTLFRNSFFPRTVRDWNELEEDAKKCDSLNAFKMQLKKKLFPTRMQYVSKGKSSINHTRMRLGLSQLRQQLHSFGTIDSSYCLNCPNCLETVTHYPLNCPRLEMMIDVGEMVVGHGMDFENHHTIVNVMLQGSGQINTNI